MNDFMIEENEALREKLRITEKKLREVESDKASLERIVYAKPPRFPEAVNYETGSLI